jgi:signal transduction histidine kinase
MMAVVALSVAPLRARWLQALIEGSAGHTVLIVAANAFSSVSHSPTNPPGAILSVLAWCWLVLWPAYRLRRVQSERWWTRVLIGFPRALAMGITLGFIAQFLVHHELLGAPFYPGASVAAATAFAFLWLRGAIITLAATRRRVHRRLRRQLMVSHALVIILLLIMMTAVGSIGGVALVDFGLHPDAAKMAQSVAEDLRLARNTGPFQRKAALDIFHDIETGYLPLRGEPPLNGFLSNRDLPTRILLLDDQGRIIAGVRHDSRRQAITITRPTWQAVYGESRLWAEIRAISRSGATASLPLPSRPGSAGHGSLTGFAVGSAALLSPSGRLNGIVTVQILQPNLTSARFIQSVVAIFSAGTVALILAASLPILGLSFLFAYLASRGLTRGLEAVSRVATDIAAGDLSRRATVSEQNEIGVLADDVNHMAASLETTVDALHAARAEAENALRTRQQLVANISHELRTPLAVIRAHLESVTLHRPATAGTFPLSEGGEIRLSPATMHALQTETERLASLIDDLFALTRAESGGLQIQREPVDVAAIVDEVASLMRPLAWRESSVSLTVEAQPGLLPALADAERLRQIIANLVRNAIRHTPEGGIIVLSTTHEAPWIVLAVADTGEGIAAEHLPHVFERFYRADDARGRDTGGAGLGLAIVRELVELMGGRVSVDSRVGEGTVFRVYLPTAAPELTTRERVD